MLGRRRCQSPGRRCRIRATTVFLLSAGNVGDMCETGGAGAHLDCWRGLRRDAEEGVGGVFEEPDVDEVVLIGPARAVGQVDGEVAFGPAAGAGVGGLDEDLGCFAEEPAAELALEGLVEVAKDLRSLFLNFRGDLFGHPGGGGALSGREGEDVHLGEARPFGQLQRPAEIVVCFTRETDDNIGRDGRAVEELPGQLDFAGELVGGIGPAHATQDAIGAGLER